jgi:hypothetical protein
LKQKDYEKNLGDYFMKWLEIIKLRSVGDSSGILNKLILSIDPMNQHGLVAIEWYRHVLLESDLSLHLHWDSEGPEKQGSTLGLRLVQVLKDLGLVDHSIWIEKGK